MKHFNIDQYSPTYDPPFKLWRRATKADKIQYMKACRVQTTNARGGGNPGADPKKVLDWRSLERRTSQLWAKWEVANNSFWDAIRSARAARGLDANHDLYIFTERDWVIRCNDDGFSHHDAVYLARSALEGDLKHQDFTVMKYEEGGREIGLLERKASLYQKCAGTYERILERALRDRLQLYLDSIRDARASRSFFPPSIYIIENEGRMRVAQSDSLGRLTWINGDVMCTTSGVG